jgi:hypothetical protein
MTELYFDTVESATADNGFKHGDVVRMYKEGTKLAYPCIMLTCETLDKFRVDAMRGIMGNRSLIADASVYTVYINLQGQIVDIGVLPNTKLRFLLGNKVFDVFNKKIHSDDQTTIEGDMLYALCLSSSSM